MRHLEEHTGGSHPDLLRLDAIRAGEGSPEEVIHLERCRPCRELLETLRATEHWLHRAAPQAEPAPPEIDQAVLEAFRRTASRVPKKVRFPVRRRWLVPAVGTAAAAALVVVVAGPLLMRTPAPDSMSPAKQAAQLDRGEGAPPTAGDINGDGTVNILDALRLARLVESGTGGPNHADLNGDGRVDSTDIEAVARRAVAL